MKQAKVAVDLDNAGQADALEAAILREGLTPIRFTGTLRPHRFDVFLRENSESIEQQRAALARAVARFEAETGAAVKLVERLEF